MVWVFSIGAFLTDLKPFLLGNQSINQMFTISEIQRAFDEGKFAGKTKIMWPHTYCVGIFSYFT
jgi:hypothetical protein